MYIDMTTKTMIIPRGKYFMSNGKKINDDVLAKYDPDKLRQKFNIWRLIIVGKKDERYWKIKSRKLSKDTAKSTITATLTLEPRYTINKIKKIKIRQLKEAVWSMFKIVVEEYDQLTHPWSPIPPNAARVTALEAFFTDLKSQGQAAKDAINALTDYDKLVDFSPVLPEVPENVTTLKV